jgi:hypothetical protein
MFFIEWDDIASTREIILHVFVESNDIASTDRAIFHVFN